MSGDTEVKTQKWTPGKWQIEQHPNPKFGYEITAPHAGCRCDPHVCVMHPRQNTCSLRKIETVCQSVSEANALLILKSPDLAKFVQRVADSLDVPHGIRTDAEALLSTLERI